MASVYCRVRSMSVFFESIGQKVAAAGEWTFFRKREGLTNLGFNRFLNLPAFAGLNQRGQDFDLIGFDPGLRFRCRAVAKLIVFVGSDVFFPTIGEAFEEKWPRLSAPQSVDHRFNTL